MKNLITLLFVAIVAITGRAQCTCSSLGPELVVNGDFSSGNTGFQTTYSYAMTAWSDNYGIATNGYNPNPGSWIACADHTTGSGNYMWADASSSNFNMPIWGETVTVLPNTNYVFSFWMSNVNGDSISCPPGKVQFSINGVTFGTQLTAPNASCVWVQNCVVWNSGSATSANISILNQNAFFSGNDFGFDDFSFKECKNGCTITAIIGPNAIICKNGSAQLTASATGATSYSWKPAAGLNNTTIANPVASPTVNTTYTVIISNGQCDDSAMVTVLISPDPNAVVSANSIMCSNSSSQLIASGGSSYSWQPAAGLSNSTISNPIATPTITTIYTVTVFSGSCSDTGVVAVTVMPAPVAVVGPNQSACQGSSVQLIASGGNNYSWLPSNGVSNPTISNPVVSPMNSTVYTVTTTNGLCSTSAYITVTIVTPPTAIINTSSISEDNTAPMTVNFTNGSLGATNSIFTMVNPVTNSYTSNFSYTYTEPGLYNVNLWVTNAAGCVDSTVVTIEVKPTSGIYVPNAFTPNSDGLNELFKVESYGILEFEAFIFDRWGQLVYKWKNVEGGWDGTYKGDLVQEDVYVWVVKARGIDGTHYNPKGHVSVVR